jgi:hypothetical protein
VEYDAVDFSIFRPIVRRRRLATAATIALAAALAGCGKGSDQQMTAAAPPALPATLPLDASPSTAWPTAPEVAALPEAKPVRTVRVANPRDYYGYADAAYDYQRVLSDAPPDYYFDYDGTNPWAWEGYDQSVVFLEPVDDGYRSYYYRPGADEPYFVRDPYYGYGYDNGQLAVVYDSYGGVVPYSDYGARLDYAGRYLARGRDLYLASRRNDRRAVSAANWAARSAAISATQARWYAARDRQPQWRDYSSRVAASQANYWREESVRRQADARRFAAWRSESFRTPPPPRAIPATWTSASWARDQKRFLPARDDRMHLAANAQPNRGAPDARQGLFGNRQRIEPGNRPPNVVVPQARDPRRQAIIAAREQQRPSMGPMRAIREPQGNAPAGRFAPRPQDQPNPPRVAGPQGKPDRAQLANMRGDHGMRGNAERFRAQPQPQSQRQPRAVTPKPQPQAGRGGGRPQMAMPRPEPRAAAPRFQPRANGGNDRARFQAPRPQPQIAAPRPQAQRFGGGNGGMRPAPQMNRPAFQPRAPQMARPAPQMARPAPPPRAAAPAGPRGGGGDGHGGGDHKH